MERRTTEVTTKTNGVAAGRSLLVRNIAIAVTILAAIAIAYALYLIIVDPVVAGEPAHASRARGFNILWLALIVVAVAWVVYWLIF